MDVIRVGHGITSLVLVVFSLIVLAARSGCAARTRDRQCATELHFSAIGCDHVHGVVLSCSSGWDKRVARVPE